MYIKLRKLAIVVAKFAPAAMNTVLVPDVIAISSTIIIVNAVLNRPVKNTKFKSYFF